MIVSNRVDISNIPSNAINPKLLNAGFIIVSACREGIIDSAQIQKNSELSEALKANILASGYAAVCVWPDYHKSDDDSRYRRKDPSFIVFNFKSSMHEPICVRQKDSLELKQLGETWCKNFAQEEYFID